MPSRPVSRILFWATIPLGRRVTPRLVALYLGLGEQRRRPDLSLLRVEFNSFHPLVWPQRLAPRRQDWVIVSVPLVLALRRTGVTRYPALWSADFPRSEGASPPGRAIARPAWPFSWKGAGARCAGRSVPAERALDEGSGSAAERAEEEQKRRKGRRRRPFRCPPEDRTFAVPPKVRGGSKDRGDRPNRNR